MERDIKMNKILFFDVDGTLYNSEKNYLHQQKKHFLQLDVMAMNWQLLLVEPLL